MGKIVRGVARAGAMGLLAWSPVAAAANSEVGDYGGTVVAVGRCAFTANRATGDEGEKRVLGAIAAAAISQGVNLIGKAISGAAAAKTWSATGSRNVEPAAASFPQCVQVVRGRMWSERPAAGQPQWSGGLEAARAALEANATYLAATPDFFFEGEIIGSSDNSALAIRPTVSYLGKPIGERTLRPGRDRSVAVFLAMTAPGTKASLETSPAASLVLGRHVSGRPVRYPSRSAGSSPRESAWFTLAKSQTAKPLTVTALVTETQSESGFLAFIGSVLTDEKVKTAVTTEIQEALIPTAGAAAATTEQAKLAGLRNAAETTYAVAVTKVQGCMAATTGLMQVGQEAKAALRAYAAADAALPSGDPVRQGSLTLQVIDGNGGIDLTDSAGIAAGCKRIYEAHLKAPGA